MRETKLTGKENDVHKRYTFVLGYKGLISKWPHAEESQTDSQFAEVKQLSSYVSFSCVFFCRT